MDDSSSLGKVSSSTESVATVTSEEFVLVQSSAAGSPQDSEGKPRLKVRNAQGHAVLVHLVSVWHYMIFVYLFTSSTKLVKITKFEVDGYSS